MKKNMIFFLALIGGIFTMGLLIASSLNSSSEKPVCKKAPIECSDKKDNTPSPDGMIWQNFSREFLSFVAIPIDYEVK